MEFSDLSYDEFSVITSFIGYHDYNACLRADRQFHELLPYKNDAREYFRQFQLTNHHNPECGFLKVEKRFHTPELLLHAAGTRWD